MPGGSLLYDGRSMLAPHDPIVGIVTHGSHNDKTGPMYQLWILLADQTPLHAVREGNDQSICGDCRHRNSTCYVNTAWAPTNIYEAYRKRRYPRGLREIPPGTSIRLGAYGDPAALPLGLIESLMSLPWKGWTGYTHQWKAARVQPYKQWLMASVDTEQEQEEAKRLGWRTFRCAPPLSSKVANEISCPASAEMGHRVTCDQCRLCMGTTKPAKDILIYLHGRNAQLFARKSGQKVLPL